MRGKFLSVRSLVFVSLSASTFVGSPVAAVNILWDGTGTSWNTNTTWSLVSNATTPNPTLKPGSSDNAVFNITTVNTPQTVNLDAAQAALGLFFNSTGTVLIQSAAGGGSTNALSLGTNGISAIAGSGADTITAPITLTGSQTWLNDSSNLLNISSGSISNGVNNLTVDGSGNTTISGAFGPTPGSSQGGIIKNGTGTLTFGNASSFYTGGMTINAGTVRVSHPGAFNTATPTTLTFGPSSIGLLQLNGQSVTLTGLSTNATPGTPVIQNANAAFTTLTVFNNANNTYAGALQDGAGGGALSLTKNGTGTLILTGTNTYTGGTVVVDGALQGNVNSLPGNIANNASVVFNQTVDGTYAGTMTGSGGLTKIGAGVLSLGGSNSLSYSGPTVISAGTLRIAGSAPGNNLSGTTIGTGATLDLNGYNLGEALALEDNSNIVNTHPTFFGLWSGQLSPANISVPSSFNVTGTGPILLAGGVANNAGVTLNKSGSSSLDLMGSVDNFALALNVNSGVVHLTKTDSNLGYHAVGGSLSIAGGSVQLGGTGGDQIYDFSPVSVTSGEFDVNGLNETFRLLSLQGTGIGGKGALVNSAAAASTLSLPVGFGSPAGIVLTGNASIGVTQSAGSLTLNDEISGNFAITKVGAGTLNLGGTNTFTGGTTIAAGTLVQNGAIPGGVDNQATFIYNSGAFGGQLINHGVSTFNSNFTAGNGIVNFTTIAIAPGFTFTLNGAGLDNRNLFTIETGGKLAATSVVNQGELVAHGIVTATTFSNSGLFYGGGQVTAAVTNTASGDIRAAADEWLRFSGANFNNQGLVEAIGSLTEPAQIEFDSPVTNAASTGLITGRNNILRFDAGLSNSGSLAISLGTSDIFGDLNNTATGKIVVSGGAGVTFYDDIIQNGTFRVSKVGSTTSVAVVFGGFSGSGGSTGGGDIFLEGDLRPGNSPATVTMENNVGLGAGANTVIELGGTLAGGQYDQLHVTGALALGGTLTVQLINGFSPSAGQAFDILDWGSLTGTFAAGLNIISPGPGLTWNTSQLYVSGTLSVGLPGDYNNSGRVDAADYVTWRKGLGTTYSLSDYGVWRSHFGQTAASGTGSAVNAAVPEPATLAVLLFAVSGWYLRRNRTA